MNTNITSDSIGAHVFDVRVIPCRVKHAQIFQRWENLAVGDYFVLINDHDPVPLYYQFAAQFPSAFSWEYLLRDEEEFRVKIRKLAATPKEFKPSVPAPGGDIVHRAGTTNREAAAPASEMTLDVRGLEPPEPMMRILDAAANLGPDDIVKAITDRRPVHLFAELEARGLHFDNKQRLDGTWITQIRRVGT
jgi:uncharacterized protein (DUF2249 family)